MDLLGKLEASEELTPEEEGKAEEARAALLAPRTIRLTHARALQEDEIRECAKLADRLRACGEMSFEERQQVRRMLKPTVSD